MCPELTQVQKGQGFFQKCSVHAQTCWHKFVDRSEITMKVDVGGNIVFYRLKLTSNLLIDNFVDTDCRFATALTPHIQRHPVVPCFLALLSFHRNIGYFCKIIIFRLQILIIILSSPLIRVILTPQLKSYILLLLRYEIYNKKQKSRLLDIKQKKVIACNVLSVLYTSIF